MPVLQGDGILVLGYKAVLRNLNGGDENTFLTFGEIAARMDMHPGQLKGIIEMLEHMGHVERPAVNSRASPDLVCPDYSGFFSNVKPDVSPADTPYRLTDKGKRICGVPP
jgi:hypothetical protein